MKWIKSRDKFLTEAKIKDVILPTQSKEIINTWGEEYLNYEEIEATENIKQGKWKLSEEDKRKVLGVFLTADINAVYKIFESLPDKFTEALNGSVDLSLLKSDPKWEKILANFDIKKPTINQIGVMTDAIFKKISVSETLADEIILKNEQGRPILGEDKKPQKVKKEKGALVYSKNLTNINSFVDDFNRCFPDSVVNASLFTSGDISRLVSKSREDFSGDGYLVEVDLYGRDMFLSINHKAKDILNMSISRFYTSCQHLYTGGYRSQLLGNVFDPNSIPAFIIFDTPIYNKNQELISEQLPLTRMMIRNIETFSNTKSKTPTIFFDRAYPDRMQEVFSDIVEKYSGNVENFDNRTSYLFTPDLPLDAKALTNPYMDRLGLETGKYIGVNADKIYLSASYDWSRVKISPKANLKEIIIETPNVPKNFFEIPMKPNWIKFKFLNILSFTPFKKIKSESYAFDKCKMNGRVLKSIRKNNPDLKKLQLTACDVEGLNLKEAGKLEELQLLYTIDPDQLVKVLEGIEVENLVLSSDLLTPENKKYISSLKSKGVKVKIIGPKI